MKIPQETLTQELIAETSLQGEVIQQVDESQIKSLFPAELDVSAESFAGNGFTYRHDWGNHKGQKNYTLNWGAINAGSRAFVSATEFGGGANEGFIGGARYTVHNVATRNGAILVKVNIEHDNPIRLRIDYFVVNP